MYLNCVRVLRKSLVHYLRYTCPHSFLSLAVESISSSMAHVASYCCFYPGALLLIVKGRCEEQHMYFLNKRFFAHEDNF